MLVNHACIFLFIDLFFELRDIIPQQAKKLHINDTDINVFHESLL